MLDSKTTYTKKGYKFYFVIIFFSLLFVLTKYFISYLNFPNEYLFSKIIRFSDTLGLSSVFVELSLVIVMINAVLAFFNLIPIPPLDGYRIAALLLPQHAADKFEYISQRFGLFIVLFFVLFLWNPIFMLVVSFLEVLTGIKIS